MKLREYQDRDYKEIVKLFKTNSKVLYQCPTGGGKSLVISQLIIDNKDKKILFLSHKREIISQMRSRLSDLGIKTGYAIASVSENMDSNIIIGSISTMMRDKRMESYLDKPFDYIIIDEAHRTRTSGYEKVLDHLFELNKDTKLFGVTATPYRMDKKSLSKYYEQLVTSDDIKTLIENGFLSNYKTYTTSIGDIDKEVEKNGNEYQTQSLSQYMRKDIYLEYLVNSYKKLGNNKQMLVFCVDKKHALSVKNKYIELGYTNIDYIDSDTPENKRKQILDSYRDKKLQIIVCIETLTEGIDLPDTGVVQLARPTKSIILYLQMLGRGTRIKENKEDLIILDCSGNTQEHGSLSCDREWSLNENVNPSQKRKRNRIIGKRSDGSYTDDESEMDFLEIEEVSPEDYLSKMGNDISTVEKINKDIIKEQYVIFNKILKYILSYNKDIQEKTIEERQYFSSSVDLKYKSSNGGFSLSVDKSVRVEPGYLYSMSGEQKTNFYIGFGELCKFVTSPKHSKILNQYSQDILDLNENKLDVNVLKEQLSQVKSRTFEAELQNFVSKNKIIFLTKPHYISYYFPREWRGGGFDSIEFQSSKINKTSNKIKVGGRDKIYNFDYEKLKSLLLNDWEKIKEFNLEKTS
jgi:superfamily II DNA or RNA helicase